MMAKRILGIGLLAAAIGVGLYLLLNLWLAGGATNWGHAALAASGAPPHGSAPTLHCWDCHGNHPDTSQAPPASGMLCFNCHSVQ